MTAAKGNKVYTITEAQKEEYRAQGFDIYDDTGALLHYGKGKTIPYEKYAELEAAYKTLQEQHAELEAARKPNKKEVG